MLIEAKNLIGTIKTGKWFSNFVGRGTSVGSEEYYYTIMAGLVKLRKEDNLYSLSLTIQSSKS